MSAPEDLEPEELEVYELFGTLREQVFELLGDLASSILVRSEQREEENERLGSVDAQEVVSQETTNLLNTILRLLGLGRNEEEGDDENE